MPSPETIDALLAGALRRVPAPWPAHWRSEGAHAAVTRRLLYHGIAGLLFERRACLEGWPAALLDTLHTETLARTMWEMRHRVLLSEAIEALHGAGVPSVLLKGTALAYAHYAEPAHRFRGDSDLLVSEAALPAARNLLERLGWTRPGHTNAPFGDICYQEIWQFKDPAGLLHDIDLHWEVTNSRALRSVLDVDQVLAEAAPLPALSPHAYGPDPVTALIHGCVNRAAHAQCGYTFMGRDEYDPDRLLWAHDFHLQATAMSEAQWEEFSQRSVDTGVASLCADSLGLTRQHLETPVPDGVMHRLATAPRDTRATRFIRSGGGFGRAWADLRATPGAWQKARFLLARAFPSPGHMRAKYPGRWPLGLLYVRRFAEAALNAGAGGRP